MSGFGVILSDVSARSINIGDVRVGLSAEEVVKLIQAAVGGATQEANVTINALAKRLGATREILLGVLKILGRSDTSTYDLPNALAALIQQVLLLRTSLTTASNQDERTSELREAAIEAVDCGDLDRAENLLKELREKEKDVSQQHRKYLVEQYRALEEALKSEATTIINLARISLARRNLSVAFSQFQEGTTVLAFEIGTASCRERV